MFQDFYVKSCCVIKNNVMCNIIRSVGVVEMLRVKLP